MRCRAVTRGWTYSNRSNTRTSADHAAEFEHVLAQTMGIDEGTYRLIPLTFAALDRRRIPARLAMLTTLDLSRPDRAAREFDRLIRALRGPIPHTG